MPMLEPVKTDTQSSESPEVPDIETLTAAIITGFREIFEHIQTQLTDLKQQNNSAHSDEPEKVKPMVSRVIAEQINTPVRDEGHSNEQVSCNRKWVFFSPVCRFLLDRPPRYDLNFDNIYVYIYFLLQFASGVILLFVYVAL